MSKKILGILSLMVLLTGLMIVSVVQAGTDRSPDGDMYCQSGFCAEDFNLYVRSGGSTCNLNRVSYVGWDLTGITQSIGSGQLTLTVVSTGNPPTTPLNVEVFVPANDTWDADVAPPVPDPGAATPDVILASTSVNVSTLSNGSKVTFGGTADTADANSLGAYFDGKKGGRATIGLRLTGSGCNDLNTTIVFVDEPDQNLEPDLILKTGADFTAVDFYSFRSGGTADMTMLGLGLLVAVGLLVGTGYTLAKRRRA